MGKVRIMGKLTTLILPHKEEEEMVTINEFQVENLKKVKAVKLEPSAAGLTVIGGRNGQGKTSILDAIAWALGGEKFRPGNPTREGALTPPNLHVELSNGIIVEQRGQNSSLKVIDSTGKKSGQRLLNEFISTLALDLPSFMHASEKEKADTLLRIIGVGNQLQAFDLEESRLYSQRTEVGRIADRKKKAAEEMPFYPGVPEEPVSASELIKQQQSILAKNGENERKRNRAKELEQSVRKAMARVNDLETELALARGALKTAQEDFRIASTAASDLRDESTEELEENLCRIDELNAKIRANAVKEGTELEADNLKKEYDDLTEKINAVRGQREALLNAADLPLPGLSVKDGRLTYKGQPWDCMSGAEQLKVAVAIIQKLNPECGFVLMDKLEQMDLDTLKEFGEWLQKEGLQVIATRVSTGDECSVIIEDGMVESDHSEAPVEEIRQRAPKFVKGVF